MKKIGCCYYFHKSYNLHFVEIQRLLTEVKLIEDNIFDDIWKKIDVIKIDLRQNKITFIEFFDFNKELFPIVKTWYIFKKEFNGNFIYSGKKNNSKANPLIFHKKHLLVDYSYRQFPKELAKVIDLRLESLKHSVPTLNDKKRIGRKCFWDIAIKEACKKDIILKLFLEKWENYWK